MPESARAFARRFEIPRVHASIDELARDRDLDVVFIASPHHCHAPQAVQLLNAGKAVLWTLM